MKIDAGFQGDKGHLPGGGNQFEEKEEGVGEERQEAECRPGFFPVGEIVGTREKGGPGGADDGEGDDDTCQEEGDVDAACCGDPDTEKSCRQQGWRLEGALAQEVTILSRWIGER